MRVKTANRRAVPALLVPLAAALLWSAGAGPARAGSLDKALLQNSPDIIDFLKEQGYRNVGVLPFKVKKGPSMMFHVSEVYVKRNGKWLFASHQSTDAPSFIAAMKAPAGSKQ